MLTNILVLLSLLAMILILRPFVEIFPSLIACLIRWKESVNLENVVTYARYRNWIAVILILPFCITVDTFNLYAPDFMAGFNENFSLLTIIGIFLLYLLLRFLLQHFIRPKKIPEKVWQTANRSSFNFFILMTVLIIATGSVADFAGGDLDLVRNILIWVISAVYVVALLRKLQILSSSCHFITAFLYLCTLEILPTGVLVASAIIF